MRYTINIQREDSDQFKATIATLEDEKVYYLTDGFTNLPWGEKIAMKGKYWKKFYLN